MAVTDRRYHDAVERQFRALVGLRPPMRLVAYRIALLALRAPLEPGAIEDQAERR